MGDLSAKRVSGRAEPRHWPVFACSGVLLFVTSSKYPLFSTRPAFSKELGWRAWRHCGVDSLGRNNKEI